ncbi:MAG: hypothetical protein RJA15_759 [Actinomycetota bacterium]
MFQAGAWLIDSFYGLVHSYAIAIARDHVADHTSHDEEHQGNAGNATSPTRDEASAEPTQG